MEQKNNALITSTPEIPLKLVDLAAFLKASIEVADQITVEKIAEKIMQIIMRESGADKGYLLLTRNDQLSIIAESTSNDGAGIKIYSEITLPNYNSLPEQIVRDAVKKNENIVINDVSKNSLYSSDKYISTTHPRSIACIPFSRGKKNMGIIYLESSLYTDIFTTEKIALLKIFAIRAALSFENMLLVNKLSLSVKRFQDIMDNSAALIFVKLLNGKYIFVNDEFEKARKIKKEKIINFTDHEIFTKEQADSYVAKDKIVSKTEKPLTYEEKILLENGMHTFIIVKFPLYDDNEKIYAIGGIATDITEIKRLEESIQTNQNRFNFVLAATQDSIYDWDQESGRIWRNEQYEKLFDGPTGPNLDWWKNNIHPDESKDVMERRETAFKSRDQLWNQEYRFKKANGEYAYIIDRGFIIYNSQRQPIRMIGAIMDITERKKFVDDLERSLSILKATLNSTVDGIFVADLNRKIIDHNKKLVEILHLPDAVINLKEHKRIAEYNSGLLKDPQQFLARIDTIYANPESESYDLLEFNDGRIIERYSLPQKLKDKTIGRVWSFHDVTQRKKLEAEEKNRIVKIIERQAELLRLNNTIINLSIKEKLNKILESASKTLDVERLSIQFLGTEKNTLSSESTYILSKRDFEAGISFKRKYYPRYFSELEFSKIIDANNAELDPRTSELAEDYLRQHGITSMMIAPIHLKGKLIGVISYEHIGYKRIWTYEEMVFATSIVEIITIALDADEREKLENTLLENEQLFRLSISQLPVLFAVFDKDLRWKMAGGRILDRLGLKPTTLIGKMLFQTNSTMDVSQHNKALEGKSSNYEYQLGETFFQRFVEPLKNTSGKIVGVISMSLDITERKKMEQKIKNLNSKLEEYVNDRGKQLINECCIVMLDVNGNIITGNHGVEHIHGYTVEEIINKNISAFYIKEEVKNGAPEKNLQIAREKGHVENTGWMSKKDESRFWANTIITALYEGNGNIKGYTLITCNTTELIKKEENK